MSVNACGTCQFRRRSVDTMVHTSALPLVFPSERGAAVFWFSMGREPRETVNQVIEAVRMTSACMGGAQLYNTGVRVIASDVVELTWQRKVIYMRTYVTYDGESREIQTQGIEQLSLQFWKSEIVALLRLCTGQGQEWHVAYGDDLPPALMDALIDRAVYSGPMRLVNSTLEYFRERIVDTMPEEASIMGCATFIADNGRIQS